MLLRHFSAVLLSLLGVFASLEFWYLILPLQQKFTEWDRDPQAILLGFVLWAVLGGLSCLLLLRHIANWGMRVGLLPIEDRVDEEVEVLEAAVQNAKQKLGIQKTGPDLGIYEGLEINAYSVGWNMRHGSLVISRGAIQKLSSEELEMLVARQLLQLQSGDVVTLALMQGIIFPLTLFVARMLAFLLGTSLRQTEEVATSSDTAELALVWILTILLTLPSSLLFWASCRWSARRSDAMVAKVYGVAPWLSLLQKLPGEHLPRVEIFSDAFKFQTRERPRWLRFQSTQPNVHTRRRVFSV